MLAYTLLWSPFQACFSICLVQTSFLFVNDFYTDLNTKVVTAWWVGNIYWYPCGLECSSLNYFHWHCMWPLGGIWVNFCQVLPTRSTFCSMQNLIPGICLVANSPCSIVSDWLPLSWHESKDPKVPTHLFAAVDRKTENWHPKLSLNGECIHFAVDLLIPRSKGAGPSKQYLNSILNNNFRAVFSSRQ